MARRIPRPLRISGAIAVVLALLTVFAPNASGAVAGAPNPAWPDECGIDAAILVDHSNSIRNDDEDNPGLMKDAAKAFADALSGTPSRLAVHSFWKTADEEIGFTDTDAAGVAAAKTAIDSIEFFTSNSNGSTNWDEAFRSVENLGAKVVLMLTDGNPTVHLGSYSSGGTVDQSDIDEGVASANRVKSAGLDGVTSRIVGVGIGGGVSLANLKLISGTTANDDYFVTNFADLQNKLIDIASELCGGSVTVSKVEQQADGSFADGANWAFTGTLAGASPPAVTSTPANGHTDADGLVNFNWKSSASEAVTIVEEARPGFALDSASCDIAGHPFPTSSVTRGVQLSVGPSDIVHCQFRNVRNAPGINVTKTADPTTATLGTPIDYDYTVTNTGNLQLHSVSLADNKLGAISIGDTTLDPGESTTGSAAHNIALADFPGPLVNVATAKGTPPSGPNVQDTDNASVALVTAPSIEIVKSATGSAHEGDEVTYSFQVTNTGNVPLTAVSVDDDVLGHIGNIASLAAGASQTLTKTVNAPNDDVHNTAEACGTDPLDKRACSDDDHDLDVIHPAIHVVKSAPLTAHQGDDITYSFEVTNTGDVTLTGVNVDDDKLGHIGTIASLAVGASQTLTKTVDAPADDVHNTVEGCGTDRLQREVCDDDEHTLNVIHPDVQIAKTAASQARPGDDVTYSFEVTNTGDVPLTGANVDDDKLGHIGTIASLAVGASQTLTKTVDAPVGNVHNVATVCGTDPLQAVTCDDDDHDLDVIHPAIQIVKTGTSSAHVGDDVSYAFEVTNTGDVTLTGISVDDDVLGHIGDIPSLAAGASQTLHLHTVAPGDDVTNVAEACGDDPLDRSVCDDDDHTLDVIHPDLAVSKTAGAQARPGDDVTYSFEVTNTGDVTLTDISVDDDVLGHIGDIPSLAPGASQTLSKTAPAPEDDVRNVATACGTDPLDDEVCGDDDHELDVIHPGIDVTKTAASFAHEGDEVTYTFVVHNTGDVALTDVDVTDDVIGTIGTIPSLAAGATTELTKDFTVPASTTAVDNVATACGAQPGEFGDLCDSDGHHLTVIHPAMTIDKKVGGGDHQTAGDALLTHQGDDLGYTVVITNTGDTALEVTALEDSLKADLEASCSGGVGDSIEPAGVITCTYTTASGADDAHNVVSVTAVDGVGSDKGTVGPITDETFASVIEPAIHIVKTADPISVDPGQTVTYTYVVTNTGDTDLSDVTVDDDVIGAIGTIETLAAGASETLTKAIVVQADTPRTNIGTACGNDVLGLQVCDDDPATISIVLAEEPTVRPPTVVTNEPTLPLTGFRLFLWLAVGTALIASGLKLSQIKRERGV